MNININIDGDSRHRDHFDPDRFFPAMQQYDDEIEIGSDAGQRDENGAGGTT